MIIHEILFDTDANGPGSRTAIWVQGCSIGCRGCFNTATFSRNSGFTISVKELFNSIKDLTTDGLTILGGEPFQQFTDVLELCTLWKKSFAHLSSKKPTIILYTGLTYDQVIATPGWSQLRETLDVIKVGPFVQELAKHDTVLGSSNQQFLFFNNSYNTESFRRRVPVEVHIEPGVVNITGYPPESLAKTLRGET